MGNKKSKASAGGLDKKEAASLAAMTAFDKDELDALFKEFVAMDEDKSGELDVDEFKKLFAARMKGATDEQLSNLFIVFDADSSGSVSFKELSTSLSVLSKGSVEDKLGFMFSMYDDGDGLLDADEVAVIVDQMRSVATALGRDAKGAQVFIDAVMKKLDADGDKRITRAEWLEQGAKTPSLLMLLGVS